MPAEDDETVTGLLALLGARLAPSDDVSANVVLAAQAAKARMQGSDSDGKAFTDVMEIKSDSRRFTFRANAYGNYARFGRTYTPEQLRQHREFLAKEEQEQQQEKARQEAEREAEQAAQNLASREQRVIFEHGPRTPLCCRPRCRSLRRPLRPHRTDCTPGSRTW